MRSPEHQNNNYRGQYVGGGGGGGRGGGDRFYLQQPEAFTILPPQDNPPPSPPPPDPPLAPQPYRLTPTSRRHKNMSFAILTEPTRSRSPSPHSQPNNGRVSPFRGRGFNPAGSRHASPSRYVVSPSPPPHTPTTSRPNISRIPTRNHQNNTKQHPFGERVSKTNSNFTKLQLSQSLSNIVSATPPIQPTASSSNQRGRYRRHPHPTTSPSRRSNLVLSPIVGSSPEPVTSRQNSPGTAAYQKAPVNQKRTGGGLNSTLLPHSQPGSRLTSPVRATNSNQNSSTKEDSTRIPVIGVGTNKNNTTNSVGTGYRNVPAKVNSFVKPKVTGTAATTSGTNNSNVEVSTSSKLGTRLKPQIKTQPKSSTSKAGTTKNVASKSKNEEKKSDESKSPEVLPERLVKLSDLLAPPPPPLQTTTNSSSTITSTSSTVVTSTTSTVTQPLKIEAKIDPILISKFSTTSGTANKSDLKSDEVASTNEKRIAPIVDGRVLSAKSVSNAMTHMNETVLDTKTLMNETTTTTSSIHHQSQQPSQIIQPKPISESLGINSNNNLSVGTRTGTVTGTVSPKTTNSGKNGSVAALHQNHHSSNNVSNNVNSVIPARVLENHVIQRTTVDFGLISPDVVAVKNKIVATGEVKPIRIMVKERPMDAEVQSGNMAFLSDNGSGAGMNGIENIVAERPGLPPPPPTLEITSNDESVTEEKNAQTGGDNKCGRFFSQFKQKLSCRKQEESSKKEEKQPTSCFSCCRKSSSKPEVSIKIDDDSDETIQSSSESTKSSFWQRLKCCGRNKVGDKTKNGSLFPGGRRKESWTQNEDGNSQSSSKKSNFFRTLLCRKRENEGVVERRLSRRASTISKKKSLTPSSNVQEDNQPKLDISLVEHTSHMRAAIPVLPIYLAWFCLVMNCVLPGVGTVFSGIFCLCLGIPRFSQKDSFRARFGAFIIDLIIGIGQCFTVLFCLVGWGWSIWWGIIMLKIAKKHKKIQLIEEHVKKQEQAAASKQSSSTSSTSKQHQQPRGSENQS